MCKCTETYHHYGQKELLDIPIWQSLPSLVVEPHFEHDQQQHHRRDNTIRELNDIVSRVVANVANMSAYDANNVPIATTIGIATAAATATNSMTVPLPITTTPVSNYAASSSMPATGKTNVTMRNNRNKLYHNSILLERKRFYIFLKVLIHLIEKSIIKQQAMMKKQQKLKFILYQVKTIIKDCVIQNRLLHNDNNISLQETIIMKIHNDIIGIEYYWNLTCEFLGYEL